MAARSRKKPIETKDLSTLTLYVGVLYDTSKNQTEIFDYIVSPKKEDVEEFICEEGCWSSLTEFEVPIVSLEAKR